MADLELACIRMFAAAGDPGWHAGRLDDGRRVHATAIPCGPGVVRWSGSVEDQMKPLVRNSRAVWVRAATEEDDATLEFQLELQLIQTGGRPETDTKHAAGRQYKGQMSFPGWQRYVEHSVAA